MKNILKNKKTWLIAALAFGGVETAAKADYVSFSASRPTVNDLDSEKFEIYIKPRKDTPYSPNQAIDTTRSYASINVPEDDKVYVEVIVLGNSKYNDWRKYDYFCKAKYIDIPLDSKGVKIQTNITVKVLDKNYYDIESCTITPVKIK